MKIFLDTNFLVYCAKQKIDYLREIENLAIEKREIIVLSSVIKELCLLSEKAKKKKDKDAALLAVKILEAQKKKNEIKILETKENPDDALAGFSEKEKIAVATLDAGLKERIRNKAEILTIRQKRHIEIL